MKIKGLLLKDIYELWAQGKVLFLLIFVYLLAPLFVESTSMNSLASVAMLLCAMFPANSIGYDERSKWDRYALSMPVSKKQLHASKFLLGLLAIVSGAVVQAVPALLLGRYDILAALPLMMILALVYMAISLPLLFRFGLEKGRMFFLLLTVLFVVAMGAFAGFLA